MNITIPKNISDITSSLDMGGLPWFLEDPDPRCYLTAPYVVFDLETTNINYGSALEANNNVVAAAWYVSGTHNIKYHRGGELDQAQLLHVIDEVLEAQGFLVAHNAKFDIQWLKRMGVDLRRVLVYDTLLGEYVLAGNRPWKLALGAVAPRYGMPEGKAPLIDLLMKGGICPSEMPPRYLKARAIRDVRHTHNIFRKQRRTLDKAGQLQVLFTRCIFSPVLADIEMAGLKLDRDRVYEEYIRAVVEYDIAKAEFIMKFGDVNPRSTLQMASLIYRQLGFKELRGRNGRAIRNKASRAYPNGAPKVDEKTLSQIKATTEQQKDFLKLRKILGKLGAELTKTLEFFKGVVDERDCVFHGVFNQSVAKTHRLSSSSVRVQFEQFKKKKGIQLQNMPRKFKDLIRPKRDGYKIGDLDGSQLEFRCAAFLGQDTKAIANIRNDVDQHAFTARSLNNLSQSAWDNLLKSEKKALRQGAKEHTFKPLYGGRRGTPAEETYYAAFRDEFPELAAVQEGWTYRVLDQKVLRMPWGMEFHFPFTRQDDRTGYIDNTPSIYNYPIQNLATAEIIPIAVTYLWHRAYQNNPDIELINTIHDSATAELPPGTDELWKALGCQTFTLDVYEYLEKVYDLHFNVPLGVGVSVGERWESPDATEWEANIERNGDYWLKGERL